MIFLDEILSGLCGLRISALLSAKAVVLMASSVCDLQHSLDQFAAECEAAGMRISTSKFEAMVLSRKPVDRTGNWLESCCSGSSFTDVLVNLCSFPHLWS